MALEDEQPEQSNGIQTSESIPTLLLEIIIEILLKLGVESLLRCKSVCKLWYSLISDPYFVESHLTLSTSNDHYAGHQLIFFSELPTNNLKSCPLNYDVVHDKSINALDLDYPLKNTGRCVSIVGSCNGLLCIVVDDIVFIWNPSTRRSNRLPPCCSLGSGSNMLYGFGYDESNDDYKVVKIYRINKEGGKDDRTVNIYSMRTGTWKNVGNFAHRVLLDKFGKFSNGALHWVATKGFGSSYSQTIVSLDLAKETFDEILQPVYDNGNHDMTLGVLGRCLCVVCNYYGNRAVVWVMKVYGAKDSWTKLVSIPYPLGTWRNTFSVPLCVSNEGEVLLKFGHNLVIYDSRNTSLSEFRNIDECLGAYTFVGSLVSPYTLASLEDR